MIKSNYKIKGSSTYRAYITYLTPFNDTWSTEVMITTI